MRKILVTGGTVFVSRFVANYFAQKGDDVYVLNRNSRPQLPNVTLIEGDRNDLDAQNLWGTMELICAAVSTREDIWFCTNAELVEYLRN